jgi:preprotein translocase subunit SecG
METILLVLHVIIAVALIAVVLVQRSESDGFGMGSGGGNMGLMSSRGSANLLTRSTAILATLFIVNSLALSLLASGSSKTSLVDTIQQQEAEAQAPAVPVDGTEAEAAIDTPSVPEAN